MAGARRTLDLDSLNPQQRQAVTAGDGPLLVLAGAGSGKTRVVTTRIGHLMRARRVPASAIVAVTFTNKAAREMAGRVAGLVPSGQEPPFIGTFHSFGVRFLRSHIDKLGYRRDFSIYDEGDQVQIVREVMRELPQQAWYTDRAAVWAISKAKGAGLTPEELLQREDSPPDVLLGTVFQAYQRILKGMHAVDFEDILQLALRLCREHEAAAQDWFGRFRHVLVDEYQDTNRVQHDLLREIVRPSGNLCAVGDDDQSIYGWRGAEPEHILRFEQDYPGARVIHLERNYRSTDTILAAANQVIARNADRRGKTLHGVRGKGSGLEWIVGDTEADEIEKVVTHLKLWRLRTGGDYGDVAILYRSNHQSRPIEEALRLEGIPYWLVGGTRFYDRKEVRDAIAYLRLVHNPRDEVCLFRVINFPGRGIGRASQTRLLELARQSGRPAIEIMREAEFVEGLPAAAARAMTSLAGLLDRYRARFATEPLGETFRAMLAELDFHRAVEKEKSDPKAKELARGNVHDFELATDHYARHNPEGTLKAYLERIALLSMPEDTEQGPRMVRLMTVHSAKGLEFPRVYLVGMAEDVFPHKRSLDEGSEAEERRLAYVAITRAERHLVLSMAKARRRYGETIPQQPSRFVLDIDATLFEGPAPAADAEAAKPLRERQAANARGRFFEQLKKLGTGEAPA